VADDFDGVDVTLTEGVVLTEGVLVVAMAVGVVTDVGLLAAVLVLVAHAPRPSRTTAARRLWRMGRLSPERRGGARDVTGG
jgi:hypothetical protein